MENIKKVEELPYMRSLIHPHSGTTIRREHHTYRNSSPPFYKGDINF